MKTIQQLAKVGRRLGYHARKNTQRLMKKGLTDEHVNFLRGKIAGCAAGVLHLQRELKARNIGGIPFRIALPLKQQRILARNAGHDSLEAYRAANPPVVAIA